jgi:LacI family transcriptional regulator
MKAKEITIYDLANQLKVSTATVSRALQNDPLVSKKTRTKIFELAEKVGYRSNHFAKNLRKQKTNTIGFLVHELQSNFINSVLAGVEKIATEAGYDIIIAHSSENAEKEIANATNLFQKRVDGLIASLSFDTKNLDHFRPFVEKAVPVIYFDRVEKSNDNTVIIIDNYKCGYEATQHLVEQGCTKIAHVTSSLARNVYAERFRGYRDALSDNGIPFDEQLLIVKDLSEKSGIDAATQIVAMQPIPDGVFITNDFVAAVCMRSLKEKGLSIPSDIAIVGFNNDAIGHVMEPALTTINYPGKEMGEVAARVLVDRLNGKNTGKKIKQVVINAELIIRQSSLKKTATT